MRFINAKFVKSATKVGEFVNDELPQVAIVGRSNVGKSSLINMLTNNSKLAKTSRTPGRTRLVNYFNINNQFYLVDLPGYGFNQAGRTIASGWDKIMDDYFSSNHTLKLVLLLLDCRIGATALDKLMLDYLAEHDYPALIVLTKTDKISKSELNAQIQKISADIRYAKNRIVSTSASKKQGVENVATALDEFLK